MSKTLSETVTDYLWKKWEVNDTEVFDGVYQFVVEVSEHYKLHPDVLMPLDIVKEGLDDLLRAIEE